uniref:Uncharacterized protein n=1 Tax=viral metagenome TaxID=1070528 RepID=A0A6C0BE76_9ZZZZ
MDKNICIGIDLGTTCSCVSFYKNGSSNVIINSSGERITPSYVTINSINHIVGTYSKKQSGQYPLNTVYDVKRLMGNTFKDIQKELKHLSYNVIDKNGLPVICIDDKEFYPEQISAMILEDLKNSASAFLGTEVKKAVITVPAYFNDAQRNATKSAGEIAGLEVLRIINEPTAAAIAYGLDINSSRNVLVYDFGGGTLDVTILNIDNGIFKVLSTCGDCRLGGEDLDNKLKDYCFMKFCDTHILTSSVDKKEVLKILNIKSFSNIQSYNKEVLENIILNTDNILLKEYLNQLLEVVKLYKNVKLMRKLKTLCEESKKNLSVSTSIDITYDNFYNNIDLNIHIDRNKFETICNDEFKRCMEPVFKALSDSKTNNIDDVVLVGGSTRVPKIRELLNTHFPNKLRTNINPDEAVANGAAINAAMLSNLTDNTINNIVLLDVTPLSIGIDTCGEMNVMIKRNSHLPIEVSEIFTTETDFQKSVNIKVFEGENVLTKDNHFLGNFEITDLPSVKKGVLRIEVIFSIDNDGIINIIAKILDKENRLTIKNDKINKNS